MFSVRGTYPAAGLFTPIHIVSIIVCLAIITVFVILSKNLTKEQFFKFIKIFTIIISFCEIFSIIWSCAIDGAKEVRYWLPLFFCSLYIYSMWATWSPNRIIRESGFAFFSMGCIVAGLVFIFFPTTSYASYPVFHFKCIYSMIFHMAMVYTGIMSYVTKSVEINIHTVLKYIGFCLIFMSAALVLNYVFDANYMFLDNPANIPLPILNTIYAFSPLLYTIVILVSHLALGPITLLIYMLVNTIVNHNEIPVTETSIEMEEEPIEKQI